MEQPTNCEIDRYLCWIEETDQELRALYHHARVTGVMARMIHGKFAVVSRGRPDSEKPNRPEKS